MTSAVLPSAHAGIPGLRFTVTRPTANASPLRSDVAGFIARTRRGRVRGTRELARPGIEHVAEDGVGIAVRVEGWRGYQREFGGLDDAVDTPYAIRGYFENGGQAAWVVRVCAYDLPGQTPVALSSAWTTWTVAGISATGDWLPDAPADFQTWRYRVEATTPGEWANGTTMTIRYSLRGPEGTPTVDLAVEAPGESPEYLTGLSPCALHVDGAIPSAFIRFVPDAPAPPPFPSPRTQPGPSTVEWRLTLDNGVSAPPRPIDYLRAAELLRDVPEIAIVVAPDLLRDLPPNNAASNDARREIIAVLLEHAAALDDRLVLLDIPGPGDGVGPVRERLDELRKTAETRAQVDPASGGRGPARSAATYHPWLRVRDPLAPAGRALRTIPASGHVAGVISRLDRERGAQHTPANAEVVDAVDVSRAFNADEQEALFVAGVNLLRCAPGRGLVVWGGRTLDTELDGRFVAHRRLIHRLVRAIRRVAEPLVFDVNGPTLWLMLVRAITSVLLEAWRAGGLKGARPDEAFFVVCNDETNPPEERDLGRVLCRVGLAPATPMEFIELTVALSAEGRLEVFEV
jgi:phage tail sheath protein FI